MHEERTIEEVLQDNPFDTETPNKYETFLKAAVEMAFANIHAMTIAIQRLEVRIEQHEQMHRAANIAAIKDPEPAREDKPH